MSIIQLKKLQDDVRPAVTAAEFTRIFERFPRTTEPYPANSIYPSSLYEITIAEFVQQYYCPTYGEHPWTKDLYTSHGNAAEQVIQQALFRAGVLDCPHECFQETLVWCPILGVKGRVDGILYKELAKHVGAINPPTEQYTGPKTRVILEIKETSDYGYSQVRSPDDIPVKFQWAQAAYQHILGIPETCFLYINRDSMNIRPVFFSASPLLRQMVVDKCQKIWYHVRNQTIPNDDGTETRFDFPVDETS